MATCNQAQVPQGHEFNKQNQLNEEGETVKKYLMYIIHLESYASKPLGVSIKHSSV